MEQSMEARLMLRGGGYGREIRINEKAACRVAPANGLRAEARVSEENSKKAAANAKAAAVLAYCWGYLSQQTCTDLFRQFPTWRSA
jgi:hypothetical protein